MIVNISKQFHSLAGKIYIFSIIVLSLKFLPIEAVSQFGMKITIHNSGVVSGALATLTLLLTIAAVPCIIRDYFVTQMAGSLDLDDQNTIARDDLLGALDQETSFDKRTKRYFFISWIVFLMEGIIPIILGVLVSWMIRGDMLLFFQEVMK